MGKSLEGNNKTNSDGEQALAYLKELMSYIRTDTPGEAWSMYKLHSNGHGLVKEINEWLGEIDE